MFLNYFLRVSTVAEPTSGHLIKFPAAASFFDNEMWSPVEGLTAFSASFTRFFLTVVRRMMRVQVVLILYWYRAPTLSTMNSDLGS